MSEDLLPQDQAAPTPEATQAPPDAGAAPDPSSPEAQGGVDPGEARPVGTQADLIQADQEQDPTGSPAVTPEEQAQYTDFVRRALLFISDDRKPGGSKKSPLQSTLEMLNNPRKNVADAIGFTASQVTRLIANGAQRAKQAFPPDVLFHGGYELVQHLYMLGAVHHLFKGVPELNADVATEEDHQWSPQEQKIIDTAFATGVQYYGKYLQDSGQITPQFREQSVKFWKEQIANETAKGEVPDSTFDKLDVPGLRAQMQDRINQQPQLLEQ